MQVFLMRWLSGCRDESPLAIVAELADAHGSGPCTGNGVGVRVPSMAPVVRFLFQDLGRQAGRSGICVDRPIGSSAVPLSFPSCLHRSADSSTFRVNAAVAYKNRE